MARNDNTCQHWHILDQFARFHQTRGYAPSVRELAKAVGMTSIGHLAYHLRQLENEGMLTHVPGRSRTLQLTTRANALLEEEAGNEQGIPVLGTIAAGIPLILGEVHDILLGVDPGYFPFGTYALRVRGNSMLDAHILDGDVVIVVPDNAPAPGAVIVATHISEGSSGAATLKAFFPNQDQVRLQPANSAYPPIMIPPDEWEREWIIQGRVVGIVRWHLEGTGLLR